MAMNFNSARCPVCHRESPTANHNLRHASGFIFWMHCLTCGDHSITSTAVAILESPAQDEWRALISYAVRQMKGDAPIDSPLLQAIPKTTTLPDPLERIDRAVQFFADNLPPGATTTVVANHMQAVVGAESVQGAAWVLRQAIDAGYLRAEDNGAKDAILNNATLTAKGWQRHAELVRSGARSRHAFMAMAFGEDDIRSVYRDHMRPALRQADFYLRTTDEAHQAAGSIDDRMRVEIRTSRFVICDLTHNNRGAYWEAGFAEGIGRPVFYTCRRDVLESTDATVRPHFDTAHQLIIPWDLDTIGQAMQKLKDAIRATLPAEARMEDPPEAPATA